MNRNKIIMAVCFIAAICSFQVFATGSSERGNALWYEANKIADASESVLPVEKKVNWQELNPAGDVVAESEFLVWYDESKGYTYADEFSEMLTGQQLSFRYAGAGDTVIKRNAVSDGLFWTPFDEGAEKGNTVNAEVKATDLWVENTGITETLEGNECLVFEYSIYRDSGELGYNFEQTVNDDYTDSESGIAVRTTGKVWIDCDGVPRQLESNVNYAGAEYKETVKYDYDGNFMYPVQSVMEGTLASSYGTNTATVNFRATETMSDYWTATDFYR